MPAKGRTWRRRKVRCQNSSRSRDKHVEQELFKWAGKNRFDAKNCRLVPKHFKDTGRGMACTRALDEGNVIIRVPLQLLITTSLVMSSEVGQVIARSGIQNLSPMDVLCVFLLIEKSKATESCWYAYLQSLPTTYSTPSYWTQKEVLTLPSWVRESAEQQIQVVEKSFNSCSLLLRELISSVPSLNDYATLEEYKWAWCTVNTRAVYMAQTPHPLLQGDDNQALAPVLDMLNHSAHIQVAAGYNASTRSYEIKSRDKYSKGQQVFISYGAHDNCKLLVEYGFLIPGNPHNLVPFDLGDLYELAEDMNVERLNEKRDIICDQNIHKIMCCSHDGISWNLRLSAEILNLRPGDLMKWRQCMIGQFQNGPHAQRTDTFLYTLLSNKAKQCISIEDLPNPSDHMQMVQQLCREQSDILEYCIGTVT